MKQSLRFLHIEDSSEDYELVGRLLSREGIACEMKRIATQGDLFDTLQNENYDLILADYQLPGFTGLQALEIAQALKPDIPFIFVSGTIGEETAIESLRNGAADYVLKDRLSRLGSAVRRALAEAEERTLRQELQQRLRQAGRMEAISTLSHGIAHDFNNILTVILGHASLLRTERANPDRVLELSETISHAAQRASSIVEQLLAFSRKSEGHLASTDLNRCVQDRLARLKSKIPSTMELSFLPEKVLPLVLADPVQVERILVNLLMNSIESMPEGGRITLSTKLAPTTDLLDLLPGPTTHTYVCLQVSDTGKGMDGMTREHLFEPFYTTKERGHATGLGLPVVYGLMKAQNGLIRVASELGEGTTISLFFCQPRSTETKTPPPAAGLDPALRGAEVILVVEDEPDVAFFLRTILEAQGYEVLSACDHSEAEARFGENMDRVALVFSDVGLPHIDGITLCTELKARKPGLPIILASGYSPKEFKDRMLELAPKAFLSKPYNTRDILHCVRTVLDGTATMPTA